MLRFQGKNVLITGGSSGIGLATAKLLINEGARVAITGRDQKALDAALAELGERALAVRSDTSKISDIDALVAKVKESFGHLDVLFVNAGIAKFAPLEAVTEAFFDETLSINLKGAFFVVQRAAAILVDGGSIVLNTSVVDELGFASSSVYAASKAGLRSLARTLGTELLPRKIRVNAVSPGPIRTPIMGKMGIPADQTGAWEEQLREANPMKRFGNPEEVAKAVLFLASSDASFTTGAELVVDGGLTQL